MTRLQKTSGGGVKAEAPTFQDWILQKSDRDYDTDNPQRPTPSVTMTTAHAPSCIIQALPSHHEDPDIGSLHAIPPNPCLRACIKAEITIPPPFSRAITAVANFPDSNTDVSKSHASHTGQT